MQVETLSEFIQSIPCYDAHAHVLHRGMGCTCLANAPHCSASPLAAALCGISLRLGFLNAGMSQTDIDGILIGQYDSDRCQEICLKWIPSIQYGLPFRYFLSGLKRLIPFDSDTLDAESWPAIETALSKRPWDDVDLMREGFEKSGVDRLALNMWESWGVSYYGRYRAERTAEEKAFDARYYSDIATFDSYALRPDGGAAARYAALTGSGMDSFEEMDAMIERLADYFVNVCGVRGFKITEGYYRPLDYRRVSRAEAKRAYGAHMDATAFRTYSDYFTWRVVEMAQQYRLPVQIHTGELWGSCETNDIHPMHLREFVESFPDVRFDLLHCGYPYMAETGILAQNHENVWINMSYMFLRSLPLSRLWLDAYLNVTAGDRILLGSDVFDVFSLCGVVGAIRQSVAAVLQKRIDEGWLSERLARELAEKLLYQNARVLYDGSSRHG